MAKKQTLSADSLQYTPSKVSWATARFLDRPPALATRVFLYAVIAGVAATIVYCALSRVAVSVEARGIIQTRAPAVPVASPVQFRVAHLAIEDGDRVHAGDVLVVGEGRLDDDDMASIAAQQEVLANLIERQKSGRCSTCLRELQDFAPRAFQVDAKGRSKELLAEIRQLLLDFITQEDSYEKRAVATSAERRQIESAEDKLARIRQLGAEARLSSQIESLESQVLTARSALAERRQALELQVSQARNRLQVKLAGLIESLERLREQETITAPASGVVAELIVTGEGQLVAPGTPLMRIVRLDSGMIAALYVSNSDIAKIAPDMKVRIKLDALPEREFGSVTGAVESIPTDVMRGEGSDASVYEVPVVLDRTSLSDGKEEHEFRLGMTLTGLVVVRHESLLTRGLRQIFHFKDSLFD